ncbi:MAG: S-adenosyl-l-methionine hydroxide adenosyltransferase family protein [Gemmatimonadota bacterium]
MRIVTLLTDFGTADGFVGEVKGELLTHAPLARLVDVAHDLLPGDILAGAWVLEQVWDRFPEGTVHLAVIDPGGGGPRRGVVVRAANRWYVGPDNGTLTRVLDRFGVQEARTLDHRISGPEQSRTFHGRDVFAPAAARLASAEEPATLGAELDSGSLTRLDLPRPVHRGGRVRGTVTHIDRFGNLVTDIPGGSLAPSALIEIGGEVISGIRLTYASVESGQVVALIGSTGMLEVSVRDGNAAARLSVERGNAVHVRPERD